MKRKRATIPFLVAAFLVAIAAKGVAWLLNRVSAREEPVVTFGQLGAKQCTPLAEISSIGSPR